MNQWPALERIFKALDKKNRLCWISGGAVRDILLSRTPLDFDLTTDATEDEILALFPQALLVGRQFGVYKIPLFGEIFDLTVFREEDQYVDGRRPVTIRGAPPDKDAQRRDFTLNALFWDLKQEALVDFVGGLADLEERTVRCVGLPAKRFDEDYLRVLRMIRFGYSLAFKIDPESYRAGLERAQSLSRISGERILAEILKLSETSARLKFYQDPLFISIMKHNDLSLKEVELKIKKMEGSGPVEGLLVADRILIELLYLLDFSLENIKRIQARLKIGNAAKKWLMKALEVYALIHSNVDYVSYCLLIDRSPDFLVMIHFFEALNLLEEKLVQQIVAAHEKFPQALLNASDILHFVPAHTLSKVLVRAREWQIRNSISDRETMVDFVKKNVLSDA